MNKILILLNSRLLIVTCYCILALTCSFANAQTVFCFEKTISTHIPLGNYNVASQKTSLYGKSFLLLPLTNNYIKDNVNLLNQIKVYSFNTDTYHCDTLLLGIPEKIAKSSTTIKSISHNNICIALLTNDQLIVFKKNNHNYLFDYLHVPSHSFNDLLFLNDTILIFGTCYNYHSKDQKEKCFIERFDISNKKTISQKEFKVDGIEFTHFVNKLYDINLNGKVAIAEKNTYQVNIYDENYTLIDSIVDPNLQWIKADQQKLEEIDRENSKAKIEKLYDYYDQVNRIEKVFFPTDNLLLVSHKTPNEGDKLRIVDVWIKEDERWIKRVDNYKYYFDKIYSTDTVTNCNVVLHELYASAPAFHFINNRLIFINPFGAPYNFPMTFKEFYNDRRSYLITKGVRFSIDYFIINE